MIQRNKYAGTCMECGKQCAQDEGFAHRRSGTTQWSVIHATCVDDRWDRMTAKGQEPDRAAKETDN